MAYTDGDAKALADLAAVLADRLVAALPGWVESCVDRTYRAWAGPPPPDVVDSARDAGRAALAGVEPDLRALLNSDIDDQRSTPLAIVRAAVRFPSAVLAAAGVPPVVRDEIDTAMFPDDLYNLSPARFADISPSLTEPGLAWGAAKAWVHRTRHLT
jgi:hypothetical protein